jgi:hypothetical protein
MKANLVTPKFIPSAGSIACLALFLEIAAWARSTPPLPSSQLSLDLYEEGGTPAVKKPAPSTIPVTGDVPPFQENKADRDDKKGSKSTKIEDEQGVKVDPGSVIEVGSERIQVKPGSIHDVDAAGTRNIGGRGLGNWYSTESEIKMGKEYAAEIEKNTRFITDPIVTEYVNRIGQNIVKNSDCKVPFTIRVIDSDEINAMALPGGFFYVNSGLFLNTDDEAEMAGVMAHEVAHVCAHHAARQMTRANYAQLGTIP